ncbi:MAG: ABC transporter substrate-binding protein [Bryobacteraceae bacterium]
MLSRCHHTVLRAALLALVAFTWSCSQGNQGRARRVRIATYTQGSLTALPLVLTQRLGLFKGEGLDVTVEETAGGTKAIEALLGGSADVGSAFHELTVQMAAQGRDLTSFVSLARYPGYVLVPSPASRKEIRKIEDLDGVTVAVSSPGSPTDLYLKYVLAQHGMRGTAASTVSAGSNMARVALLERGTVGAAVLSDPAMTLFLRRHPNSLVFDDVRNQQGVKKLYGTDSYVSAALIARRSWLQTNPDVARRLARAVNRGLNWIHTHSIEEIEKETPDEMRGNDPALFAEALRLSLPSFPPTARFEPAGVAAVMKVLQVSDPEKKFAGLDSEKTYTSEFAAQK